MPLFKPRLIHLYNEGASSALNLDEIAIYLRERLGKVEVYERGSLIADHLSSLSEKKWGGKIDALAKRLAGIKVHRLRGGQPPSSPFQPFSPPLKGEIEYEKRYLQNSFAKPAGILYDGFRLQNIFFALLPQKYLDMEHLQLIFTNQLFGTWDENDRRYHARVSIYGTPGLISTAGIVEAPAKPREFYLLRQQYDMLGKGETGVLELKERLKGRFIDYDDERLTEVVKGYCLQAIFFHLTGDSFCPDKNCRLYNAHWQEEVIAAQLKGGYELCASHQRILSQL